MKQTIEQAVQAACAELFDITIDAELTRPEEKFGDYATNVALRMSKQLGRSPRELAEQLATKLRQTLGEAVTDVSIAGPGFLNVTLSDAALQDSVAARSVSRTTADHSVVIETNNPNPFKAMHIGHAFNAIVADAIANLIDAGGVAVWRVSYHGDVGAHVGKSMYSLLSYVGDDIQRLLDIPETERNSFMSKMYAEGAQAYKQDEQAQADIDRLAQQSFVLDDPVYKQVYETCKQWSFDQIDHIVEQLGNKPIVRRYLESEADALGVQTVREHVPDVFQESNGALIFQGSNYGTFDNVFVSRSGRGLYGARDIGLMQLKHRDYPAASKSYIVTAEEQRDYFKGVIKAAELCLPELDGFTVNISTGTVKLSTGKMSSRTGDVIEIGWLFDKISEAVLARGGEAASDVVAGALRYQFLKVRVGSDVTFDIAEAVSLQGNSGPYLQYAHARARSILAKAASEGAGEAVSTGDGNQPDHTDTLPADGFEPGERSLLRKISEYPEVVDKAVADLMPHYICTYLYELAQTFNSFYEHNRVIGDPRQAVRLQLAERYADTLRDGLTLLGITAPERM
ncbi:MAG TPA: arginine--tRNA ligase [Candidatus Saccharimonadales bacterium]|jgi:arginyl-tRNA synthetase